MKGKERDFSKIDNKPIIGIKCMLYKYDKKGTLYAK